MATVVVTDSTACLPPGVASAGLRVVPITLLFTDHEARDDEVEPAEVYGRLARGEEVKSHAPSAAAYLDAIDEGDPDAVLVLTPAREFTVMLQNAELAASLTGRPTVVIDTRTAAAGQGLVVAAALAAAAEGADLEVVAAAARRAVARAELVAAMFDVSQIERSGHVPQEALAGRRSSAVAARFRDGQVVPMVVEGDPLRSLAAAWLSGEVAPGSTVVFHAARPREAELLTHLVSVEGPPVRCSAAMGVHVGPDAVGVAWLRP